MRLEFETNSTPEQLLAAIRAYVERAGELLESRDTELLEGLGEAVDMLCTRIKNLTPEESKRYVDEIQELHDCIDLLGNKMKSLQGDIANTIKSLGRTKHAANAYQKNKPEEA